MGTNRLADFEAFDRNGGAPPGRGRRRTGPHRFDQMLAFESFDRNGGAPPGRGRRRTGPHCFDQMLERTAEQTNERTKKYFLINVWGYFLSPLFRCRFSLGTIRAVENWTYRRNLLGKPIIG